jgi:HemY protein
MFRVTLFLVLIGAAALGLTWLADHPGQIQLLWGGYRIEASAMVGLGFVLLLAILVAIAWAILRFVFKIPSLFSIARRARRREKGMHALSRGMIAVGSGDPRAARRHAAEAQRLLGAEPLALLLQAQAAQLAGDRAGAEAAFNDMLKKERTELLGLRGLHLEARRRGDDQAALDYAARAQKHAPTPWAGQALLDHRAASADWAGALDMVEKNAAAGLIDKPTATRWRAVLKTGLAETRVSRDPHGALALALEAVRLAPDLAPAAALAGRLTAANGDYRRASKILESAYAKTPHPDLAVVYLRVRPGDSASDRLVRARALARVAPHDPESHLTIARAALEARDFKAARNAIAPLIGEAAPGGRPTVRACLLMADLEETEGDAPGAVREWLARASRGSRDRAWVGDGFVTDVWAPASPRGKLDAFVWRAPDEKLSAPSEFEPPLAPVALEPPRETAPAPADTPEPAVEALPAAIAAPDQETPELVFSPRPPDDPGAVPEKRRRFRLFS